MTLFRINDLSVICFAVEFGVAQIIERKFFCEKNLRRRLLETFVKKYRSLKGLSKSVLGGCLGERKICMNLRIESHLGFYVPFLEMFIY